MTALQRKGENKSQIQSPDNASTSTSLLESLSSLRIASSESFSLSWLANFASAATVENQMSALYNRCLAFDIIPTTYLRFVRHQDLSSHHPPAALA